MKKYILAGSVLAASLSLGLSLIAQAAITPPPPPGPTVAEDCKDDGWRSFGDMFKNQGDCVSFVVTDGRNEPDGPPIH